MALGDLLRACEAGCGVANYLGEILIHLTDDTYRLVKDEIIMALSRTSGTW